LIQHCKETCYLRTAIDQQNIPKYNFHLIANLNLRYKQYIQNKKSRLNK
jgi:hypothetical protein